MSAEDKMSADDRRPGPLESRRIRGGMHVSRESGIGAGVLAIAVIVLMLQVTVGGVAFSGLSSSVAAYALVVATAAFGQGVVMLSGGFDLSIPWTMTTAALLLTRFADGSDSAALWVIPAVLLLGAAIGAANGLGVVILRLPAIVMTLATNVVVQGLVLLYTEGSAQGVAPPVLGSLTNDRVGGIPASAIALVVLLVAGSVLMSGTTFGRRVAAVGASPRTAFLSGVNNARVVVAVYAVSGLCAALAGILLAGYSGQSTLNMGDPYLLPVIAAVVLGGAAVTGGRGVFLGTLAGAVFIGTVQSLLATMSVAPAWRTVIFGCVILFSAVVLQPGTLTWARGLVSNARSRAEGKGRDGNVPNELVEGEPVS
ncbi:ABC transporter permease [Streptosporangium sp. NBC_01756]|uniref:ABC transporter permease n=1 Tax=Streptosporangium sp. NBC_01756 TaxID=2975950 RepID=UPI002DDA0CD0|nr:ABC transporter permease [Streptosporangium sp. NBC_01756]WSC85703.1 ABC transporter permease [Streptosporangium sp. NBC_01756]